MQTLDGFKVLRILFLFICGILNSSSCDGSNTVIIGNQVINDVSSNVIVGSGVQVSEERAISDVAVVIANAAVDVVLSQGEKPYLKITIDDNILPFVKTSIRNDSLSITTEKSYRSNTKIKVLLVLPKLHKFILAGSGNVNIKELSIPLLYLGITGAGNIRCSGIVSELNLTISGSGDVHGYELIAQKVSVDISGAGNVKTFAKQAIKAKIKGVGRVYVKGKPAKRETQITGVGNLVYK